MSRILKTVGIGVLSVTFCTTPVTVALSVDREVYDKPEAIKSGKTIHGKVVKVDEKDANLQRWDVSVKNETIPEKWSHCISISQRPVKISKWIPPLETMYSSSMTKKANMRFRS
ncbi:MAG: hypothetical protein MRJ68_17785 [Nitrospira sp.]|nr:hypothetical protein [Nitrospira sp.]